MKHQQKSEKKKKINQRMENNRNSKEVLECDHIFDSSTTEGEFQLPMLPPSATVSGKNSQPESPKNLQVRSILALFFFCHKIKLLLFYSIFFVDILKIF